MTNLSIGVTISPLLDKSDVWQSNPGDREYGHLDQHYAGQRPAVPSLKRKVKRYESKKLSQSTSARRNRINYGSQAIRPPDAKANPYKSCVDHYGAHATYPGFLLGNRSFDCAQDDAAALRSFDYAQDDKRFGPRDVLAYVYAVFHSPTYRERYAEFLKIDFPRVPLRT